MIGLASDFIGVLMLLSDVVRIQLSLKRSAAAALETYRKFEDDYGGAHSLLEELQKFGVPGANVDEMTDDIRSLARLATGIADAAAGVARYVIGLAGALEERVKDEQTLANKSLWFSYLGGVLILIGFVLQSIGAWPC